MHAQHVSQLSFPYSISKKAASLVFLRKLRSTAGIENAERFSRFLYKRRFIVPASKAVKHNSNSSISFSGSNFYVRDEQDIRSLAIEIASLTKRQQRGRGLRMA